MEIVCKVCGKGAVRQVQRYRMSGPVVFIGYLFVIPSVLGVCWSGILAMGMSAENGAAAGVGAFVCLGLSSFAGGLLGWLLVQKKRVLECGVCGATIAAD